MRSCSDDHPVTILDFDPQQPVTHRPADEIAIELLFRPAHGVQVAGRAGGRCEAGGMIVAMKNNIPLLPQVVRIFLLGVLATIVSGCSTLGYYSQSISGHLALMSRARPFDEVLADPTVSAEVKERLRKARVMREFASTDLALPDNDSYKEYADLQRAYVVWNVFAAPELSLQPRSWCFLIVGCVSYRGYYNEREAKSFAAELRANGDDVYVGGVPAYSTLGWFDDPLLNTVMHYDDADLAGLIFHELAHQVLYIKNDSKFNESFATTVEIEGVRRWLRTTGVDGAAYKLRKARRQQIIDLILKQRARLQTVYASDHPKDWKLRRKQELLTELREQFSTMSRGWEGVAGFRRWFDGPLNNAKLLSIATYYDFVPAFQALLDSRGGDLEAFYRDVRALAKLGPAQRESRLEQLAPRSAARD